MSNNKVFIKSSISEILLNVVSATNGVGSGIETYPLYDYIMQSAFLKMTGFQEQKMKCICWSMATNDYEYRYEFTKTILGECSSYNDKTSIYKDLIKLIVKHDKSFTGITNIDKSTILSETTTEVIQIFNDTNLSIWAQNRFNNFPSIWSEIQIMQFANDNKNLFTEISAGISLKKIYKDYLYVHRNRSAHNSQSYQQNLPTLKTLIDVDYRYENYFLWFAILILIDKIFIELYKKYIDLIE
jgi:hypothetical protein